LDLIKGGERLPGRRGTAAHENDLDMFPLSFRAYMDTVDQGEYLPVALAKFSYTFGSLIPRDFNSDSLTLIKY